MGCFVRIVQLTLTLLPGVERPDFRKNITSPERIRREEWDKTGRGQTDRSAPRIRRLLQMLLKTTYTRGIVCKETHREFFINSILKLEKITLFSGVFINVTTSCFCVYFSKLNLFFPNLGYN